MKLIIWLAIISGLLLAGFLILRPVIGEMGKPIPPNVRGRASNPVPDGTLGPAASTGGTGSGTPTTGPPLPRPSAADAAKLGITHAEDIEQAILALVNEERLKAGLKPALQPEPTLQETARSHSDDMFIRNFFDHNDPDSLSPADRIAIRHRQLIGLTNENIWQRANLDLSDKKKVARQIMDDWMHSPGHRANILNPAYTHLGVGVSVKGNDVEATQNFAAIRAETDQPVPLQVRAGESLSLVATPVSPTPRPEQFEFFSSDQGRAVGAAQKIAGGTANVPAGVYKLRFYFPKHGGYDIYWGPQIQVQ
ncbi:MAG TPA: CAP domain-containing protein [Blastocatellia bacterium]|nr:CAP domain-containing protein [Blastocatellia bacterium]